MSRTTCLLLGLILLTACGAEGSLGLPLGFATPTTNQIVSDELYVSLGEIGEFPEGISFFVDGEFVDTDLLPPFETWIDTATLADGQVRIAAHPARDSRTSPIDEIDVIVDNHGPAIAFESPLLDDCVPAGGELTVRAHVVDHVGVRTAELRVNSEPVAVFEGAPYEMQIIASDTETEHRLTIAAENSRGRITNATLVLPSCAPVP